MSFTINLIPTAYAAGAATDAGAGTSLPSLLLLGGFLVMFYFMLWRPQSQRAKEHQALVSNLKKGDEVVTSGGVLARISRLGDDFVSLTIAEGVELKVQKSAIASVMPKGTIKSI